MCEKSDINCSTEICVTEIKYLKELLKQKYIIVQQQQTTIIYLQEQILLLNIYYSTSHEQNPYRAEKSAIKEATTNSRGTTLVTERASYSKVVKDNDCSSSNKKQVNKPTRNPKQSKEITKEQLAAAVMEAETKTKIQDVISLEDQLASRKIKRSRNNLVVGSMVQNNAPFKAIHKSSFLHVYRVAPQTSEDDIVNHLKPLYSEVVCEKLDSKHPESYSSFKITLNEDNLKSAMCLSKWPAGTHVNRFFHFKKRATGKT